MLRTLIKHEFYATRRIMWPIFLGMAGLTLLFGLLSPLWERYDSDFLELITGLLGIAFFFGMFALCLAPLVLSAVRFRQSLLSEEAYLTMTLPVSLHEQLIAKLFVSALWYVAVFCVSTLLMMVLLSGQVVGQILWRDVLEGLEKLRLVLPRVQAGEVLSLLFCVLELLLDAVLAVTLLSLMVYASYAIGYSCHKHKSLGTGILLYLFFHVVTVGSVFICAEMLDEYEWMGGLWSFHLLLATPIPCCLLFGAIFYAITYWFLSHRLNLE